MKDFLNKLKSEAGYGLVDVLVFIVVLIVIVWLLRVLLAGA